MAKAGTRKRIRGKAAPYVALREAGAISATFHPDGSVASVVFGAAHAEPAKVEARPPVDAVAEAIARPFKTDVDSLDDLPEFEGGN